MKRPLLLFAALALGSAAPAHAAAGVSVVLSPSLVGFEERATLAGATGKTPLGIWRVYRKVMGWDWVLWYPRYFHRGFALHGHPSVPAFPASHGCVRLPMWFAPGFNARWPYGATVRILP